jgi:hypothetical protein
MVSSASESAWETASTAAVMQRLGRRQTNFALDILLGFTEYKDTSRLCIR